MGTTVSTNIGLIKPDINESIKQNLPTFNGWSAQHAANMDLIDSLFRKSVNPTTWTLTWSSTGVAPTLGTSGFTEGKYVRLFPKMVFAFFRIFCGTASFTAGTASYKFNLPTTVDPDFAAFSHTVPIGKMIYQDNSAIATSTVMPLVYSPASDAVFARPSEGGTWSATLPVAPANNDRYTGYLMYPTRDV